MIDGRNLGEIKTAYPMPWGFVTAPGVMNGMARIAVVDGSGAEVPLSVCLKVLSVVTHSLGAQQSPTPA